RGWMCFMDQSIAAIAGIDGCLRGVGISRYDNRAIRRNEAIAITLHRVLRREGGYGHIVILINKPGADLVNVDSVSFRTVTLIPVSVRASFDINAICLLEVIGHRLQAFGTVYLERNAPAYCPWREDQVRVSKRVIRMQVSYERHSQPSWFERGDPTRKRSAGTPNNARPEVN